MPAISDKCIVSNSHSDETVCRFDKEGVITGQELGQLLRQLGQNPAEAEVQEMMDQADKVMRMMMMIMMMMMMMMMITMMNI